MNSDAFKDRLKAAIGDDSNRSFADKCGLSEGTVCRYLKGDAFPPLDTLQVLAEKSGCSLPWLASGEGTMKPGAVNDAAPGWGTSAGHPASRSAPDEQERPLGWFYEWLEDELKGKSVTEIMRVAVKIKNELDKEREG